MLSIADLAVRAVGPKVAYLLVAELFICGGPATSSLSQF